MRGVIMRDDYFDCIQLLNVSLCLQTMDHATHPPPTLISSLAPSLSLATLITNRPLSSMCVQCNAIL